MEELKFAQGRVGAIGDDLINLFPELEILRGQEAHMYFSTGKKYGLEITLYVRPDCHEDKSIDPINGWAILIGGHGIRFDWSMKPGPDEHWPAPKSICGCEYRRQLNPEIYANDRIRPKEGT